MAEEDYTLQLDQEYGIEASPSKTFAINWERNHIIGTLNDLDALKQTIQLILMTDRYKWGIYSWQYGSELTECIGNSREFAQSEVKRMITDAFANDDRIKSVDDFKFSYPDRYSITVSFRVRTVFGETTEEVTI